VGQPRRRTKYSKLLARTFRRPMVNNNVIILKTSQSEISKNCMRGIDTWEGLKRRMVRVSEYTRFSLVGWRTSCNEILLVASWWCNQDPIFAILVVNLSTLVTDFKVTSCQCVCLEAYQHFPQPCRLFLTLRSEGSVDIVVTLAVPISNPHIDTPTNLWLVILHFRDFTKCHFQQNYNWLSSHMSSTSRPLIQCVWSP